MWGATAVRDCFTSICLILLLNGKGTYYRHRPRVATAANGSRSPDFLSLGLLQDCQNAISRIHLLKLMPHDIATSDTKAYIRFTGEEELGSCGAKERSIRTLSLSDRRSLHYGT